MDYTGTGNTLNMMHPHVLQLLMDSLRYWVLDMHVDGFRFDLASTLARELHDVDRLSVVLRSHPAGSGHQPGQADRRAVGRRRRRLPGRQLPAAVVGVERQVPRLGARLLARDRSDAGGVRLALHRQLRSLSGHRPAALREHQLHHRARRLHAPRSRLVQREAQRGQRRGQPRRREAQPLVELRRRGADRRSGRSSRCAHRQMRNFLATLLLSQGVPMLCGGDEIGRTQQGNNNAYCQDNELSWYDWEQADTALLEFSAQSDQAASGASGLHPPPVVPGPPDPRQRGQRHRLVHARRDRDVGPGLADRFAKSLGVFLNGAPSGRWTSAASTRGRQLLRHVQRALGAGGVRPAGVEVGRAVDDHPRHQRAAGSPRRGRVEDDSGPGQTSTPGAGLLRRSDGPMDRGAVRRSRRRSYLGRLDVDSASTPRRSSASNRVPRDHSCPTTGYAETDLRQQAVDLAPRSGTQRLRPLNATIAVRVRRAVRWQAPSRCVLIPHREVERPVSRVLSLLIVVGLWAVPSGRRSRAPITVSAAVSLTDALTAAARGVRGHGAADPVQLCRVQRAGAPDRERRARSTSSSAPTRRRWTSWPPPACSPTAHASTLLTQSARGGRARRSAADLQGHPRSADPSFKRIAIGDPAAVPAGVYAKQYLEKEGLWERCWRAHRPDRQRARRARRGRVGRRRCRDRLSHRRARVEARDGRVACPGRPRSPHRLSRCRDRSQHVRATRRSASSISCGAMPRPASSSASGSRLRRRAGDSVDVWRITWFTVACRDGRDRADPAARAWRSRGCWRARVSRAASLVETFVSLPLVMPPVATGLILLMLLSRRGVVGRLLADWASRSSSPGRRSCWRWRSWGCRCSCGRRARGSSRSTRGTSAWRRRSARRRRGSS